MKPHPRIRKTIKWGGAAVTVLLVVVWIWSGWGYIACFRSGWAVGLEQGHVFAYRTENLTRWPDTGWIGRMGSPRFTWDQRVLIQGDALNWAIGIPLWVPVGMTLLASAAAWRLDTLARRRARVGLCPKCHYDRAGLASDAARPECGASAA